jgi:hypothetical protein
MEKHYVVFDGKEYQVQEPTVEVWNRLSVLKDLYEENEFHLMLISIATGLSIDDIKQADWEGVYETSNFLADYFLKESEKFYKEFEFKGVKYHYIDLENLTFGEFIDIEEFLSRPQAKQQSEINWLLALLYREVDKDGKVLPYDASKVKERSELFRNLPMKYTSAFRFFFLLEDTLRKSTRSSLHKIAYRLKWRVKRHLRVFGGGILHWYIYLVKTSSKLMKSLKNIF